MNRAGHATSGLAAGFAAAPPLGITSVSGVIAAGVLTSAGALLPDLDHPNSTIATHLGPVTGTASKILRGASAVTYRVTAGPKDEDVTGKHRHLTHTVVFAAALGFGVTAGCEAATSYHPLAGVAAVFTVLLFLTSVAAVHFGRWVYAAPALVAVAAGLSAWLTTGFGGGFGGEFAANITNLSHDLGWFVAIGCVVHCLGDALTKNGCPFLWPLPILGETFYEIRPPKVLRFRTGGPAEKVLVGVFTVLAAVLAVHALVPDVAPYLFAVAVSK